jgi:hypothetical protein
VCVRGASGVADKAKVSVHPLRGHDVVKLVREVNIGKALASNICNTGPNMCDNKQQLDDYHTYAALVGYFQRKGWRALENRIIEKWTNTLASLSLAQELLD